MHALYLGLIALLPLLKSVILVIVSAVSVRLWHLVGSANSAIKNTMFKNLAVKGEDEMITWVRVNEDAVITYLTKTGVPLTTVKQVVDAFLADAPKVITP